MRRLVNKCATATAASEIISVPRALFFSVSPNEFHACNIVSCQQPVMVAMDGDTDMQERASRWYPESNHCRLTLRRFSALTPEVPDWPKQKNQSYTRT